MNKLLITNITNEGNVYTFDANVYESDGTTFKSGTKGETRELTEGEDRDTMFKNMAYTSLEIFVDGVSIGFGNK